MLHKKIMIVDDDKVFLEDFREILALHSFEVIPVNEIFSAPYLANVLKPDLIFLDLKKDGLDGYQLAKILKQLPGTSSIPIVAMTDFVIGKGLRK